jgi:hypothetical protein
MSMFNSSFAIISHNSSAASNVSNVHSDLQINPYNILLILT